MVIKSSSLLRTTLCFLVLSICYSHYILLLPGIHTHSSYQLLSKRGFGHSLEQLKEFSSKAALRRHKGPGSSEAIMYEGNLDAKIRECIGGSQKYSKTVSKRHFGVLLDRFKEHIQTNHGGDSEKGVFSLLSCLKIMGVALEGKKRT